MPSSAYPAPRGGRGFARFSRASANDSDNVPPPLISYKNYALDLNSISCAASQPQYIALGGAHLHCFLHDRRMLGRDRHQEAGRPAGPKPTIGTNEDEAMSEATRCVRRFAPNNKRRMGSHDTGHITACKISDANPNEMIASWSGDFVYSFDIVKSPDARDKDTEEDTAFQATRLRTQTDRKRKRKKTTESSSSLVDTSNSPRQLRRVSDSQHEAGQTALRIRYENGETDEMSIPIGLESESNMDAHDALLTEAQQLSERVSRALVQLRKTMFDFSVSMRADVAAEMETSSELTPFTSVFTQVLGQCSILLPDMDEVIRTWTYPINPSEEDISLQNTLRRNRQSSWRFVQASGCLCRVLGGKLQTLGSAPDPRLHQFAVIRPAIHEGRTVRRESRFCYDLLKAILCWLDGGQDAVLQAFKRPPSIPADSPRFPLDESDDLHTFVSKLHDYLMELANEQKPVVDLDRNRFEHDDTRHVFSSQRDAVTAFTRALAGIQLEARQSVPEFRIDMSPRGTLKRVMDRGAAARFWGVKVGRSLLMEAAEGVTFDFVNRAFGGLRLHLPSPEVERSQEDIDTDEEERVVEAIDVVIAEHSGSTEDAIDQIPQESSSLATPHTIPETDDSTRSITAIPTPTVMVEDMDEGRAEAESADNADENENEASSDEEDDSDDDNAAATQPVFRRGVAFGRSRERAAVNMHVPYSSHTKVYKGHCNTRTVKDVNFYGLNDEYVVSGSDDGHFFIWDRKTCKVVNILEGDGEVVNVVQGHPYEPMIACSGIDSTVKIFGAGGESRDREAAAKGIDVANPGGSVHSSLGGRRRRRARHSDDEGDNEHQEPDSEGVTASGLRSRKAMHKEYEITSQNDAERRRGYGDAFVTVSSLENPCARTPILSGLKASSSCYSPLYVSGWGWRKQFYETSY
jgi:DDB1- and CUL4-associated factor 6